MEKEEREEKQLPLWKTLPALIAGIVILLIFRDIMFSGFDAPVACWIVMIPCLALGIWFFTATKSDHLYWALGMTATAAIAWFVADEIGKWGYGVVVFMIGTLFTAMIASGEKRDALKKEREEAQDKPENEPEKPPGEFRSVRALPSLDDLGEEEPEEETAVSVAEIAPFEHPVMRHLLFYGAPGAGKTTLAKVMAQELQRVYDYLAEFCHETGRQSRFITVTPTQLKEPAQLARLVESIGYGDIVLLDEIHGLAQEIEESLYSVLQDFLFSVTRNGGDHMTIDVPRFTLIGATTLAGDINKPLRDRMLAIELEPSSIATLTDIVKEKLPEPTSLREYRGQRNAKVLLLHHLVALRAGFDKPVLDGITDEAATVVARRALGIPRTAKAIRDNAGAWAIVRGDDVGETQIEVEDVEGACAALEIDNLGLHRADRKVLEILAGRDKPMGEAALAAAAMASKGDLVEIIEPRLQYHGLMERSARGRVITDAGLLLFGDQAEIVA